MDDNFLYQNRPAIRADYIEELYSRISIEQNKLSFYREQLRRPIVWISLIFMAAFFVGCVQKLLTTNFHALDVNAGVTIYEVNYALEVPPDESVYEVFSENYLPGPMPENFIEEYQLIPLSEALELLPYEIHFPTNLPDGYSLQTKYIQNTMHSSLLRGCITLFWAREKTTDFYWVNLYICPHDNFGRMIKVAPGKWEEIDLNGTPAILVNGSFPWLPPKPFEYDFDNYIRVYWDDDAGASLLWEKNGVDYYFETQSPAIDPEDLILMAESMLEE